MFVSDYMVSLVLPVGFLQDILKLLTAAIIAVNGFQMAKAGCMIERNQFRIRRS